MPLTEDRDNAHHLSPSDGLSYPSLVFPREPRLAPPLDLAHTGNEARHDGRILALIQWVHAELVEEPLSEVFATDLALLQ